MKVCVQEEFLWERATFPSKIKKLSKTFLLQEDNVVRTIKTMQSLRGYIFKKVFPQFHGNISFGIRIAWRVVVQSRML